MTMDDIKAMSGDWITPATAAAVLRMDTGRLIQYARNGELPFAVRISGNRVLISRKSFLEAYGCAVPEENKPELTPDLIDAILGELRAIREILMTAQIKEVKS